MARNAADKHLRADPRVYSAVAMLALTWGILVVFYVTPATAPEILAFLSGYALIYSGLLILREAGVVAGRSGSIAQFLEHYALFFLVVGLVPSGIVFRFIPAAPGMEQFVAVIISTLYCAIAYSVAGWGLYVLGMARGINLARQISFWVFVVICCAYLSLEIGYSVFAYGDWVGAAWRAPWWRSGVTALSFMIAKVSYTIAFLYLLTYVLVPKRVVGRLQWSCQVLFGMP